MNFGKMINKVVKEYTEDNIAIRDTIITFLKIPIYKTKKITTNNVAVSQLTPTNKLIKIKGYIRYEDKD